MNHLYDIYNKKGKDFVERLFNSFVTVNEKMDGSSFNFERDRDTGKFIFYKRNQRSPITLVDRTISKYYEKPIQYIESLPPHIIEQIPRGWRFGMEYFSNTQPVEIVYDHLPKNHLILSYVHEKDDLGKITNSIEDKEELDKWADILGIERPPIIFQGNLSDEQKNSILEFLTTPFPQLVQRFKTNSFVSFVISVLNSDLEKTALNNDTEKAIEGIVFRFGDPDNEDDVVLAKMVDPVFTEVAKQKAKNRVFKKPNDFLGITLLDTMNFILERGVESFQAEGETEDKRYVSFMSDVFVEFLKENGSKYRNADFQEPDYLKKDEFKLNKDLIMDDRVEKLLDRDSSHESLFKLMLNSFRKIRKKPGGIITKDAIAHFNALVEEIKNYIEKPRDKDQTIKESEVPSFLGFKQSMGEKKIEYVTEEDEDDDHDDIFYSYDEFISALETINDADTKYPEEVETDKKVNLMVGRFQPFHKGHLKMAQHMKAKNDLPSVVAVVHSGNNRAGNSPFSREVVEKYMDVIKENNDEIADYKIFDRGFIGNVISEFNKSGYKIENLGCGNDRLVDYQKQEEYLKNSSLSELLDSDFGIVETPRDFSGTEVRERIKADDFLGFKKMVTPEVASLYNMFRSSINESSVDEVYTFINEAMINWETEKNLDDMQKFVDSFSEFMDRNQEIIEEGKISMSASILKKKIADFVGRSGMPDREQIKEELFNAVKKIFAAHDILVFDTSGISEKESVVESDGFGTQPFYLKKDDGAFHYFFTLEMEKEEGQETAGEKGFYLHVGKYSEYEAIQGPKNSYMVLNINEVSPVVIEDLATTNVEPPQLNKEKISLSDNEMSRLFELVTKCIIDYLGENSKVFRIYDELQDNIEFEGDYIDHIKSIIHSLMGEEWKVQEGSDKNLVLITR